MTRMSAGQRLWRGAREAGPDVNYFFGIRYHEYFLTAHLGEDTTKYKL